MKRIRQKEVVQEQQQELKGIEGAIALEGITMLIYKQESTLHKTGNQELPKTAENMYKQSVQPKVPHVTGARRRMSLKYQVKVSWIQLQLTSSQHAWFIKVQHCG